MAFFSPCSAQAGRGTSFTVAAFGDAHSIASKSDVIMAQLNAAPYHTAADARVNTFIYPESRKKLSGGVDLKGKHDG